MYTLAPLDDSDKIKPSQDLAKGKSFSMPALVRLLQDCEDQPAWRALSDLCCAYVDGYQLTAQQEYEYRKNKLDPRVTNLCGRVVNSILGQEAKSRRDPRLEPDDDEGADVSDVLNVRLKEAQRETNADAAISNGYSSQVRAGIGWVYVGRNSDPRQYQYRVEDVHRDEMWWDWRAKKIDLSDARWICRRQWVDLDVITAAWPQHKRILEQSVNGWADWLTDDIGTEEMRLHEVEAYSSERAFNVHRGDWIDGGRRRVRIYEIWYQVPAEVVVMRVGHRWIAVDESNPMHVEAISRGVVKLERRVTMEFRRAMFAGPHRLSDKGTKATRYPYVPFFAFRADKDNTPYGPVHGMIAPQDEYNERRMRIQWMLKAQQLLIDRDGLDEEYNTIEDIVDTMMRPDMVAVLSKTRTRDNPLTFRNDFQLQREQFEMMQDAKETLQDVPGVYGPSLGKAPAGVTSGIALNSLVEQGIVAMGELNDNYSSSRRLVYDLLVDLIAEDHSAKDMRVQIGAGQTRRTVILNTRDPKTGQAINVVPDAKVTTGLAEVPATPAYMMQMSVMMSDMIRALAGTPQAGLLIPAWVENTSAFGSNRKMLADDMRRMSGLPVSGDRQTAQQWQQQQQEAAAAKNELEQRTAKAELELTTAKALLDAAKARLTSAQTNKTLIEADAAANDPNEQQLIDESIREAMSA